MFNGIMTSTQRTSAEMYALQVVEGLKAHGMEVTGENFAWMVNGLPLPLTFKAHTNQQRHEALNGGKVTATVREFTSNRAESYKETKAGLEIEAIIAEVIRVIQQDGPVLLQKQRQVELMENAQGMILAAQLTLQDVHEGAYVIGSIAKTDNGRVPVVQIKIMGLPADGIEVLAEALADTLKAYKENAWAGETVLRKALGIGVRTGAKAGQPKTKTTEASESKE